MIVCSFWRIIVLFIKKKKKPKQLTEKWQKNEIIFLWKKIGLLGHLKIMKVDRSLGMSC